MLLPYWYRILAKGSFICIKFSNNFCDRHNFIRHIDNIIGQANRDQQNKIQMLSIQQNTRFNLSNKTTGKMQKMPAVKLPILQKISPVWHKSLLNT
jgi:hypothetical protein